MADLLDINLWVGLVFEDHPAHRAAKQYWHTEAIRPSFCRVTSLGLLRVSTLKNSLGGQPLSSQAAWDAYRSYLALSEVDFLREPSGVEELLKNWSRSGIVTPKLWTDAYLAAFAIAAELRLVTFDRDFDRFPGLDLLRL